MQLTLWFLIVSYGIFYAHQSGKRVRGMGADDNRRRTGGGWNKQEGRMG